MDFVPWTSFDRIVARYGADLRVRSLRCGEQFRIMAFAQMTYRESLRDIEACLGAQPSKLYGMGLREAVIGRCQRVARLAHMGRHRRGVGSPRTQIVRQR